MKGTFWQKFISLNLMVIMHLNLIICICQKVPFIFWLTHMWNKLLPKYTFQTLTNIYNKVNNKKKFYKN